MYFRGSHVLVNYMKYILCFLCVIKFMLIKKKKKNMFDWNDCLIKVHAYSEEKSCLIGARFLF